MESQQKFRDTHSPISVDSIPYHHFKGKQVYLKAISDNVWSYGDWKDMPMS